MTLTVTQKQSHEYNELLLYAFGNKNNVTSAQERISQATIQDLSTNLSTALLRDIGIGK
jgi:hypothetical protein